MKAKEIRALTTDQMLDKEKQYKEELFNLRFQQATGQLENTARLSKVRKNIARIKTILSEKALEKDQWKGVINLSESIERNHRHVYQGEVISDKNDKTITVVVDTYKNHPVYKKRIKYSKKYYAQDDKNEAKVGDTVRIMETRPLSRTKRFRLVKIVKKSV